MKDGPEASSDGLKPTLSSRFTASRKCVQCKSHLRSNREFGRWALASPRALRRSCTFGASSLLFESDVERDDRLPGATSESPSSRALAAELDAVR